MVLRVLCVILTQVQIFSAQASEFKKSNIQIIPNVHASNDTGSKLSSKKINPIPLEVELALSPDQQEKGLMFRKTLANGKGMLFVFPNEQLRSFWMKNTLIPLSIAFIDERHTIFQISDMQSVKTLIQKEYDRAESVKPAKYVLEVPQGWFSSKGIKSGSKLVWVDENKFVTQP